MKQSEYINDATPFDVADAEHHEVSAFSPVSRNMERTNIVADFRPLLDPYYGGASA
jgi:hypothetical protein